MARRRVDVRARPSLRDRQRSLVLADVRRAAFRLIIERGFDEVTTEEIALAAGVSPRTFFRYFANKEDVLLGVSRQRGTAIASLLEQRTRAEPADLALASTIVAYASSFEVTAVEEWRQAISSTPDTLARVTMIPLNEGDRIVKLVAERMGIDPSQDLRPGLLVHVAFAAGNFAFQQWIQRPQPDRGPLHQYVEEALTTITGRQWR